MHATQAMLNLPSPSSAGWEYISAGQLLPVMMTNDPASKCILEQLYTDAVVEKTGLAVPMQVNAT